MWALGGLVVLAACLKCTAKGVDTGYTRHCRCRPHQPCWPSLDAWQTLNSSTEGNLVAVQPVARSCHDPNFDASACNAARNQSTDSIWRASQPGALQWVNWEAWPEKNQSCHFTTPRGTPCSHGRLSLWSVVARKAEHIQAAVRFATQYNLRIAIKSSGHCFLGRSAAPESLQISTHWLKDITFHSRFSPAGADGNKHYAVPAVTIGSGVGLNDLYKAAAKRNVTVVAGFAHTVAAAGGYIQGGGHSPLGTWKGMASDQALEFHVVDAKGNLVIANDYQNQSLFWALRGGGGGTFGVVVSVTVKTFPNVATAFAVFNFVVGKNDTESFWEMAHAFNTHLPAISNAGGSGYIFYRESPLSDPNNKAHIPLSGVLAFANHSRTDEARKVLDAMAADVRRYALPQSTYAVYLSPQFSDWILGALPGRSDETGTETIMGSRLISRDFMTSNGGTRSLTSALKSISRQGSIGMAGILVSGGAVATNQVDSALNPAWRSTLLHIVFGLNSTDTTTVMEQKRLQRLMTDSLVPELSVLEPHMGSYLNEADANEKAWQQSFWGSNYPRLYQVKQQLDPDGVFVTRKGVGSEDWSWDNAGFCRRA